MDIQTRCTKCQKASVVRGVDWAELQAAGIKVPAKPPVVDRICAPCRFRMAQAGRPMTEAQKAARKEYNRTRNQELKAALAYYRAAQEGDDDTEE